MVFNFQVSQCRRGESNHLQGGCLWFAHPLSHMCISDICHIALAICCVNMPPHACHIAQNTSVPKQQQDCALHHRQRIRVYLEDLCTFNIHSHSQTSNRPEGAPCETTPVLPVGVGHAWSAGVLLQYGSYPQNCVFSLLGRSGSSGRALSAPQPMPNVCLSVSLRFPLKLSQDEKGPETWRCLS